jgi:ankyrin repeat protein
MTPTKKRRNNNKIKEQEYYLNKKKKRLYIRKELSIFFEKFNIVSARSVDVIDLLREKDVNGNYPLFIGCQFISEEQLSLCMIEIFPEAIKQGGWTGNRNPFHLACAHGKLTLLSKLLKIDNALINEIDMDGRTPLFYACKNQRLDVIRYLIKNTLINVNAKDSRQQTAFHYSCELCLLEACNELLNYEKLQGEEKDKDGNTPLFALVLTMMQSESLSICINSIAIIKKIIKKFPKSLYYHTNDGCNILHMITRITNNNIKIRDLYWQFFVTSNNILVNEKDNRDGLTPIHYACIYLNDFPNYLLKTSRILTRNFNPHIMINQKDNYGQTVFHLSCKLHNYNAFKELLKYHDINIELEDMFGNTALHAVLDDMPSVSQQSESMVRIILDISPFMILRKNFSKDTPIDIVRHHIKYATELVEFGSEAAQQDLIILTEISKVLQEHLLKARKIMFEYFISFIDI